MSRSRKTKPQAVLYNADFEQFYEDGGGGRGGGGPNELLVSGGAGPSQAQPKDNVLNNPIDVQEFTAQLGPQDLANLESVLRSEQGREIMEILDLCPDAPLSLPPTPAAVAAVLEKVIMIDHNYCLAKISPSTSPAGKGDKGQKEKETVVAPTPRVVVAEPNKAPVSVLYTPPAKAEVRTGGGVESNGDTPRLSVDDSPQGVESALSAAAAAEAALNIRRSARQQDRVERQEARRILAENKEMLQKEKESMSLSPSKAGPVPDNSAFPAPPCTEVDASPEAGAQTPPTQPAPATPLTSVTNVEPHTPLVIVTPELKGGASKSKYPKRENRKVPAHLADPNFSRDDEDVVGAEEKEPKGKTGDSEGDKGGAKDKGRSKGKGGAKDKGVDKGKGGGGQDKGGGKAAKDKGGDRDKDDDEDEEEDDDNDPDKLWCTCRQPHNNRFMICCDSCEEWFHGKCVGMTRAQGKVIEDTQASWHCPACKRKEKAAAQEQKKLDKQRSSPAKAKVGGRAVVGDKGEKKPKPKTPPKPTTTTPKGSTPPIPSSTPGSSTPGKANKTSSADGKGKKGGRNEKGIPPAKDFVTPMKFRNKVVGPPGSTPHPSPTKMALKRRALDMTGPLIKAGSSLGKASGSCVSCDKAARPDSAYCSNECVIKHSKQALVLKPDPAPTLPPAQPAQSLKSPTIKPKLKRGHSKNEYEGDGEEPSFLTFHLISTRRPPTPTADTPTPLFPPPTTTANKDAKKELGSGSAGPAGRPQQPHDKSLGKGVKRPQQPHQGVVVKHGRKSSPADNSRSSWKGTPNILSKSGGSKTPVGGAKSAGAVGGVKTGGSAGGASATKTSSSSGGEGRKGGKTRVRSQSSSSSGSGGGSGLGREDKGVDQTLVATLRETMRKTLRQILVDRATGTEWEGGGFDSAGVAASIEHELVECFGSWSNNKCKNKYRSIIFNLKDQKNALYKELLGGRILAKDLVRMEPHQMASAELTEWRTRENEKELEAIKRSEMNKLAEAKKQELIDAGREFDKIEASVEQQTRSISIGDDSHGAHGTHAREHSKHTAPAPSPVAPTPGHTAAVGPVVGVDKKRGHSTTTKKSSGSSPLPSSRPADKTAKADKAEKKTSAKSGSHDNGKGKKGKGAGAEVRHTRQSSSHTSPKGRSSSSKAHQGSDGTKKRTGVSSSEESEESCVQSLTEMKRRQGSVESRGESEPELPSSTVKTPELGEEAGSGGSGAVLVYSGMQVDSEPLLTTKLVMPELGHFHATLFNVSHEGVKGVLFPETPVPIVGRIAPETVWDYVDKMKKNKELIVFRLEPEAEKDMSAYMAFFSYLSSRNRFGVLGGISFPLKDVYLIPLNKFAPINQVLLPFRGPGLPDKREHCLLAVVTRHISEPKVGGVGGKRKAVISGPEGGSSGPEADDKKKRRVSPRTLGKSGGGVRAPSTTTAGQRDAEDDDTPYTPWGAEDEDGGDGVGAEEQGTLGEGKEVGVLLAQVQSQIAKEKCELEAMTAIPGLDGEFTLPTAPRPEPKMGSSPAPSSFFLALGGGARDVDERLPVSGVRGGGASGQEAERGLRRSRQH